MNVVAHRIEMDVNNKQASALRQHCGAARVAFNHALSDFKKGLEEDEWRNDKTLRPRFNKVKHMEYPWLKGLSANVAKNAIVHCGEAIDKWRKGKKSKRKVGFPKFRSIKRTGYRYQADNGAGSVKVDGKQVKLPKIGWLKMRETPRFNGLARKAFIKERGGRWFITLTFARPDDPPKRAIGEIIGIDAGLKHLAVLSDGAKHESPKPLKRLLRKLRMLNKKLSRQQKGSNRRKSAVAKLSKLHYRTACIRLDHLHKTTTEITNRVGLKELRMETLSIKGMMQNRRLARAIADAGIHEFQRQIEYKSRWKGVSVSKADRWFASSKLCHVCGEKNDALKLADRSWKCVCGAELDRDVNAALNLAASSAVCGRGESVRLAIASASQRSVHQTDYHRFYG